MKAASIKEIKQELESREAATLVELCVRLARYRKENKELFTYLLFEADHERSYVANLKEEINELFAALPVGGNTYYIKKSLRKILRFVNRQIRYSGIQATELELRIHFCTGMKEARVAMPEGTVLFNLYQQQLVKITTVLEKLPEDMRTDYAREMERLR